MRSGLGSEQDDASEIEEDLENTSSDDRSEGTQEFMRRVTVKERAIAAEMKNFGDRLKFNASIDGSSQHSSSSCEALRKGGEVYCHLKTTADAKGGPKPVGNLLDVSKINGLKKPLTS